MTKGDVTDALVLAHELLERCRSSSECCPRDADIDGCMALISKAVDWLRAGPRGMGTCQEQLNVAGLYCQLPCGHRGSHYACVNRESMNTIYQWET